MSKLKPLILPSPDGSRFDAVDPLDSRYHDCETSRYLSERSRIAYQAQVEAALARALATEGICSAANAHKIETAAHAVKAEDVAAEEDITRHDIKALVNCIKRQLDDDAKPYVHFGATSYDIISTAASLQMRQAVRELVVPRLKQLLVTLIELADQHAETVQIGRTHGQHAVPITFGFAVAGYVSRLGENIVALGELADALRGKFSGAVGASNALSLFVDDPITFEKTLLGYLDIEPAPYSTQIVPAERMIRLIDELAITAGILANLAHDMRHLQRTEIAEVRERFEPGQTGSSTMAHKRNPWNFENIISMSKQVTAQLINANLNISSEHQRDLTDSASSRFYPVVLATVASMAGRLNKVMGKIEVDAEAMQRNLHLTRGAIAAEPFYLLLEKYGHTSAHETVKELAHKALSENKSLYEVAETTEPISEYWQRMTPLEHELIRSPEDNYIGLSAQKTRDLLKYWQTYLQ